MTKEEFLHDQVSLFVLVSQKKRVNKKEKQDEKCKKKKEREKERKEYLRD